MESQDVLLAPLHIPPAYAAVVERLRRSIALGVVLPGEKLPPERTLAEGLGVSRVTVREALRVLQGEGLIVTRRGGTGGAVVTSRDVSIEQARGELRRTRAQVDAVFELRMAVETMAARLAAERRSDADLARLAAGQRALLGSGDVGEFRRADSNFHLAVADAARNAPLRATIEDARATAFQALDVQPFEFLVESSAAGHAAVLEAIDARRPDAASRAMAEHLSQAQTEVLSTLTERGRGAATPAAPL